MNIMRS